ncbi:MAG: MmgE/PrpD family protein [Trueperaceae bacterium]|nr:MmgE/PrpD family protein [Trueperaceae bacterium]
MRTLTVKVHPSSSRLPQEEQFAWKLAELAADNTDISSEVADMVVNRLIDNASVALASLNRTPVANARTQALCHPRQEGASLFGLTKTVNAEWAAWANATAVRELDFHDTFLAADYSHPGDNIPPLLAVAQQCNCDGQALLRGIVTAYEVHISLVKGISLHQFKKDHMAHLCPATTAGLGAMLGLETSILFQAINQAVHTSFSTRQSRKGEISSWKAYVPGYSAMLAILAVDRAMRGEKAPAPIYEGEDSVIAWMLGGKGAQYQLPLVERGEEKRAILESYTKEHSAEYQAQAIIDLAFKMRSEINDFKNVEKVIISTSHHTHYVIGTGSNDPQKFDPEASRETLDHSIMYIFAVALEDGHWHHVESYTPERASRPDTVRLWQSISTQEDPYWTERYHDPNPDRKAFGARVEIYLKDGRIISDELAVANAHSNGARPFQREDYIRKFETLTKDSVESKESSRFLALVQRLPELTASDVKALNPVAKPGWLRRCSRDTRGIF